MLEALAAGGGPHGFDCDGKPTITTTKEIIVGNDVILDGLGNLTVSGGGIGADNLIMTNRTVSTNTASTQGGGALLNRGDMSLVRVTLSSNGARNGQVAATSGSNNVESPGDSCRLTQESDQVQVTGDERNLGALADNGGPTQTHAL